MVSNELEKRIAAKVNYTRMKKVVICTLQAIAECDTEAASPYLLQPGIWNQSELVV